MAKNHIELGTESIGKLLMRYAIPSIIASTAMALYNITDSIFIGHGVGALAISGLAITFPLMNISAAFGTLVGAGASSLLSLRLGQKDYDSVNNILGNVFVLNLILGTIYAIIVLIFLEPILYFFGASPDTLPYAYDFMQIIVAGNVITHMYFGLNAMIRASGQPMKSMTATIMTVAINVVLNPLFIFGFGWGIRGSALATVISQFVVLLWQLHLLSRKESIFTFSRKMFRLKSRIVRDSIAIGLSPFMMNLAASVIVILINYQLLRYGGDLSVGAYGIVNRVASLFVMIVIGLNQGMQPIAGYNYGAKNYSRVMEVLKKSMLVATVVMTVGFLAAQIFPEAIASTFTRDSELIRRSVLGIRIVFVFYPLIGFAIVVPTFFQSIGMAGKAIVLSLTRQIIFLIPCLLILPKFWEIRGVWWAIPVSDIASSVVTAVVLIMQTREFRKADSLLKATN